MASSYQLTSDQLGNVLVIPEQDWTVISKRVGLTMLAEGISSTIVQYLLGFPDLVIVCRRWRDHTFSGLIDHANKLDIHSANAIRDFESLQLGLSELQPTDPLPADLRREAETVIGALADSTQALNTEFAVLNAEVTDFTIKNQIVDQNIEEYSSVLGPEWQSIFPSTGKVDAACGIVRGTWQALADDLSYITAHPVIIDTSFLLSLQIEAALSAWGNLQKEAVVFGNMADGQEQYLSGDWLSR